MNDFLDQIREIGEKFEIDFPSTPSGPTSKLFEAIKNNISVEDKVKVIHEIFKGYKNLTGHEFFEDIRDEIVNTAALKKVIDNSSLRGLISTATEKTFNNGEHKSIIKDLMASKGERFDTDEEAASRKEHSRHCGFYALRLDADGFSLMDLLTYYTIDDPDRVHLVVNGKGTFTLEEKDKERNFTYKFSTLFPPTNCIKGMSSVSHLDKIRRLYEDREVMFMDELENLTTTVKLRDEVGDVLPKQDFIEEITNGCKAISLYILLDTSNAMLDYDGFVEFCADHYDEIAQIITATKEFDL